MNTVHKFAIDGDTAREPSGCLIALTPGARILHVDQQNGGFFLWAIVDTDKLYTEEHCILIVGTGWNLDYCETGEHDGLHHLNTILAGPFVWHVLERVSLQEFEA